MQFDGDGHLLTTTMVCRFHVIIFTYNLTPLGYNTYDI
jgi:hypothetical protein